MKNEIRSLFVSVRTFSRKICRSVGQINSPSTTKVKGPQRKLKAVAAAGMLGIAALVGAVGCSSSVGPDNPIEEPSYPAETTTWSTTGSKTFTLYKAEGVSPAELNKILGFIADTYDIPVWPSALASFESKIDTIEVHPGDGLNKSGTIMKIGSNESYTDLVSFMLDIADGIIAQKKFDNSKETVRLAMGKSRLEKMI